MHDSLLLFKDGILFEWQQTLLAHELYYGDEYNYKIMMSYSGL